MSVFFCRALAAWALCLFCVPVFAAESLEDALAAAAPAADPKVIGLAMASLSCAARFDRVPPQRLAVIDYSRPSTEPRLWVFDLGERRLLFEEWVAHGRNSGANYAHTFSNAPGSYESSLGLFRTGGVYEGHNGYSLRLEGLESGVNDRAGERAIVMHGAPYVNAHFFRAQGRLGRSQGCPAVRPAVARELIDALKGAQYLFAYYPDPKWLASSSFLHCPAQPRGMVTAMEPSAATSAGAGSR